MVNERITCVLLISNAWCQAAAVLTTAAVAAVAAVADAAAAAFQP